MHRPAVGVRAVEQPDDPRPADDRAAGGEREEEVGHDAGRLAD
jgi:hypothetical protein